jgi:hypothetical protein
VLPIKTRRALSYPKGRGIGLSIYFQHPRECRKQCAVMTTDINTVAAWRAMARPQLMPPPDSRPACDSSQSVLPQLHPGGGADLSQHAPPASRSRKRRANRSLPASLLEARLCELFWHQPDVEQVAEIEQRIANVLEPGKPREEETPTALMPEAAQLFDDLYDLAVC